METPFLSSLEGFSNGFCMVSEFLPFLLRVLLEWFHNGSWVAAGFLLICHRILHGFACFYHLKGLS